MYQTLWNRRTKSRSNPRALPIGFSCYTQGDTIFEDAKFTHRRALEDAQAAKAGLTAAWTDNLAEWEKLKAQKDGGAKIKVPPRPPRPLVMLVQEMNDGSRLELDLLAGKPINKAETPASRRALEVKIAALLKEPAVRSRIEEKGTVEYDYQKRAGFLAPEVRRGTRLEGASKFEMQKWKTQQDATYGEGFGGKGTFNAYVLRVVRPTLVEIRPLMGASTKSIAEKSSVALATRWVTDRGGTVARVEVPAAASRRNSAWDRDWAPPARVPGGMRQENVARRLAELADARGYRIETKFNFTTMYADPGDTAEVVLARCR